jgi:hypothetical protein
MAFGGPLGGRGGASGDALNLFDLVYLNWLMDMYLRSIKMDRGQSDGMGTKYGPHFFGTKLVLFPLINIYYSLRLEKKSPTLFSSQREYIF